jgi:uncharacterized protein (TIGR02001 family)
MRVSSARRRSLGALLTLAPLGVAQHAWSQVAPSATITTNYLYRGVSLSDGQPALDLALLYDDKSGAYVGGSLIGEVTRHQGAQALGHQEYLGYAWRLRPGSTLDFGVNNLYYRSYSYPVGHEDATEVYAGWVTSHLNYYIHYSPNYFRPGANALYGEVNGAVRLLRPLRLFGHVGALTPLGGGYDKKERYDVRAGIAAAFKHGEVQLAWTTARPAPVYVPPAPAYVAPAAGFGGPDSRYVGSRPVDVAPASQGRGVVALALTWFF